METKYLKYKNKYLNLKSEMVKNQVLKAGAYKNILVFDIDDTLYSFKNHFGSQIGDSIIKIMQTLSAYKDMGFKKLADIEYSLLSKYGTTLAGLVHEKKLIDTDCKLLTYGEFYDKVNKDLELKYEKFLQYDEPLVKYMEQLIKNNNIIMCFTNGDETHAIRVLKQIGLYDLLCGQIIGQINGQEINGLLLVANDPIGQSCIISFNTLNDISQTQDSPNPIICKNLSDTIGFEKLVEIISKITTYPSPLVKDKIIFFDDSDKNILSAHKYGLKTVYICKKQKVNDDTNIIPDIGEEMKRLISSPESNMKMYFIFDPEFESAKNESNYSYCEIPFIKDLDPAHIDKLYFY